MATKTYSGSCYCGRVKFRATLDLAAGTSKCNCRSCWKRRWWSASVPLSNFQVVAGEEELQHSAVGMPEGRGWFCRHCGIIPYMHIEASSWNDGAYVQVSVAALDDLDPAELLAAPVKYADGLHDNWWNPPAETRYL